MTTPPAPLLIDTDVLIDYGYFPPGVANPCAGCIPRGWRGGARAGSCANRAATADITDAVDAADADVADATDATDVADAIVVGAQQVPR